MIVAKKTVDRQIWMARSRVLDVIDVLKRIVEVEDPTGHIRTDEYREHLEEYDENNAALLESVADELRFVNGILHTAEGDAIYQRHQWEEAEFNGR